MDRKHEHIRSNLQSFWTTIRVTIIMVAGAAITLPKKDMSPWTALQGQKQVFVAQLSTFQFRNSVRGFF